MHNCVAVGLRLACFGIRRVVQQSIESSKMCLQLLCRSTPITIDKTQQETSYGQTSTENLTIIRKRLLGPTLSASCSTASPPPYVRQLGRDPRRPWPLFSPLFGCLLGSCIAPPTQCFLHSCTTLHMYVLLSTGVLHIMLTVILYLQ